MLSRRGPVEYRIFLGAAVLGAFLFAGLGLLGYQVAGGVTQLKALDRTVTVKGLAEREAPADIAIWPIQYTETGDDLSEMFSAMEVQNGIVAEFLAEAGFRDEDVSIAVPTVLDREAQGYGRENGPPTRYSATSTITVYSRDVDAVRQAMKRIFELGKTGIAITGQGHQARTEFLFTGLNALKPEMIEEATRNARAVADKFARDSDSRLGKIKQARQGQFSISDRDSNTPYIKKIRVVSTLEYYLSD